jgi:hypothetical protein
MPSELCCGKAIISPLSFQNSKSPEFLPDSCQHYGDLDSIYILLIFLCYQAIIFNIVLSRTDSPASISSKDANSSG